MQLASRHGPIRAYKHPSVPFRSSGRLPNTSRMLNIRAYILDAVILMHMLGAVIFIHTLDAVIVRQNKESWGLGEPHTR